MEGVDRFVKLNDRWRALWLTSTSSRKIQKLTTISDRLQELARLITKTEKELDHLEKRFNELEGVRNGRT